MYPPMCGRVRQHRPPGEFADWSEARVIPLPNRPPTWNLAPTQDALVVRRHPETGERRLDTLRWGLVPRWAKDTKGAARLINARSETVATAPAFRDAFRKRRVIVPADGYYEWRAGPDGKQPYTVAMRDGTPMGLAGLWDAWRGPGGEVLRTFTILTGAPNAKLAALHDRMPVILPRDAWPAWLGEVPAEADGLLALLRPCPSEWLAAWPVSRRVGKVSEDDAALIARDSTAQAPKGLADPPVNALAA